MKEEYKYNGQPLTPEQIVRLDNAANAPISFDEDAPILSQEQLKEMRAIAAVQRKARKKGVVSLRLDSETINIAKAIEPSYTSLMGRVLYKALRDPEYIKDCL